MFTDPGSVPDNEVSGDVTDMLMINLSSSVWNVKLWRCEGVEVPDEVHFDLLPREQVLMNQIVTFDFWPHSEKQRESIRRLPFVELKTASNSAMIRRCIKCFPPHYKPDRTHHCSRLQRSFATATASPAEILRGLLQLCAKDGPLLRLRQPNHRLLQLQILHSLPILLVAFRIHLLPPPGATSLAIAPSPRTTTLSLQSFIIINNNSLFTVCSFPTS